MNPELEACIARAAQENLEDHPPAVSQEHPEAQQEQQFSGALAPGEGEHGAGDGPRWVYLGPALGELRHERAHPRRLPARERLPPAELTEEPRRRDRLVQVPLLEPCLLSPSSLFPFSLIQRFLFALLISPAVLNNLWL